MYEIILSTSAQRELKKLEKIIQERIISKLERIRVRPETYLKKLVGTPDYSLRVGDYRLIIELDKGKLILHVIEIGHRKNIYKQ
ncbi:type II toxin-antitoxin system RelE/ParE family toxin [Candidatus Woesearchaeota archaeon]|nr:type II toxin-antitoxin system RelE/ParE family toxin [Candidatus Woesearchaeota archaeon]